MQILLFMQFARTHHRRKALYISLNGHLIRLHPTYITSKPQMKMWSLPLSTNARRRRNSRWIRQYGWSPVKYLLNSVVDGRPSLCKYFAFISTITDNKRRHINKSFFQVTFKEKRYMTWSARIGNPAHVAFLPQVLRCWTLLSRL